MASENTEILTVDPTEGSKLKIAGGDYRIVVSGKQTGGTFAVIEMSVPAGGGPNPHAHPDFEESFFVLEGEVTFKSETGSYLAKTGSFINIPKGGKVHCFKNLSGKPAKLLCTVIPSGLEVFFAEASEFIASASADSPDSALTINNGMAQLSEKYGQKLFPPDYLD